MAMKMQKNHPLYSIQSICSEKDGKIRISLKAEEEEHFSIDKEECFQLASKILSSLQQAGHIHQKSLQKILHQIYNKSLPLRNLEESRREDEIIKSGDILQFAEMIDSKDEKLKLIAIKGLENLGDNIAVSVLAMALKDKNAKVRLHAACALGKVGNDSVIPLLLGSLHFDESAQVREKAAMALGELKAPSAHKQMLKILKNQQEESNVRAAIAKGLGKFGKPEDIPALVSVLKEKHQPLRLNAIKALGKIGDPTPIPSLEYLLQEDKDSEIREAARQTLYLLQN